MDGLEYSTRFPFLAKFLFSGAFAVSFRECIHLLSSHHPYPFLPIFPTLHGPYYNRPTFRFPSHLTSATPYRSPETASGITLPSATRSPWSPKTWHLGSTTWGMGTEKVWRTQQKWSCDSIREVFYPLFGGHQPTTFEGVTFSPVFFNSTR